MSLRIKFNLVNKFLKKTKFFMLFFILVFTATTAAANNSVSNISVKQNEAGIYNILLKLDKSAAVKKSFDGKSLILTIPSVIPADSMEIIYDNAAELQNVTVQKKNTDSTMIILQGKNIENAQIFTKDISTGVTKKLEDSNSIINSFFFVADKNLLALSAFLILLMLTIMSFSRPAKKEYTKLKQTSADRKFNNKPMTLRRKNMTQSSSIPSINYAHNGSFSTTNVSIPTDFAINENLEEERIRKAG